MHKNVKVTFWAKNNRNCPWRNENWEKEIRELGICKGSRFSPPMVRFWVWKEELNWFLRSHEVQGCPAQIFFTRRYSYSTCYLLNSQLPSLVRELPSSYGSCLFWDIALLHPCLQEAAYSQWLTDAGNNSASLPEDEKRLWLHLLHTATPAIKIPWDHTSAFTSFLFCFLFLAFSSPNCFFLHSFAVLILHLLKSPSLSQAPFH